MNKLKQSLRELFIRSVDTIRRFPASIALAVGFTVVTFIRIYMDFPEQLAYNYLLTCSHMAIGAGMFAGLFFTSWTGTDPKRGKYFNYANIGTIVFTLLVFVLLYAFGASTESIDSSLGIRVSEISGARITALITLSVLWFIYSLSISHKDMGYPKALFMLQKSFIIAFIYGMAILLGTTGIAGAVQALLYKGMSSKVYMYISALSALMGFIVFVSYFPESGAKDDDDRWEEAQRQPKFISILFGSILIPVISVLTIVLIVWVGKTVITSSWPEFGRLSSITTSYVFAGLWLYFMTSHFETETAKKYRAFFPYSALMIMAFELVALIRQLQIHGIQTEEYAFGIVLIFGIGSSVVLLLKLKDQYVKIIALLSLLIAISVLPYLGYHTAPVIYQLSRLENLLESNQMLKDGMIVQGENVSDTDKIAITDSVEFLSWTREIKMPSWFDRSYGYDNDFIDTFGFEKKRSDDSDIKFPSDKQGLGIFLQLSSEALKIDGYNWVAHPSYVDSKDGSLTTEINGNTGKYTFRWLDDRGHDLPIIQLFRDGEKIYEGNIKDYTDRIISKYKNGVTMESASIDDMQIDISTDYVDVKILFGSVNIDIDPANDEINRWIDVRSVYFKEK